MVASQQAEPALEAAEQGREAPGLENGTAFESAGLRVYDTVAPPDLRSQDERPSSQQPSDAETASGSFVYDYYRSAEEPAGSSPPEAPGGDIPVVQVLTPEGELAYMDDAPSSAADSEDSNAENHYTHEYPDEGECGSGSSDSVSSRSYTSNEGTASDSFEW
ncbi:hypothetical protein WJX81_003516 [Elliptochloris bilobata]|uniref:Probable RNA polymerase II nuclear localization protein SLC7A6OS n=1 Tax=Elliptochloris bilobata TaxID=381761 RepID=A0AAW1S896_9CHLO